ncbi:uncharacterized protein EDB91DRAFT_1088280 [Suillus paluster]|uniref:uncharacterized protein n=1 Tax=Suillus paluster TaxID=48578 RepID=UPI001B8866A3|nr:uncharacterized protein EDB91DRAFT_1088280 [Suillus paluster]KAG1721981.1 hypothetical protein EDB91DRAFT_1088280 [Suillus paluster]
MFQKFVFVQEHAMGYLKGTWESLRGLHVYLDTETHIQYASLWIIPCIHLHAFSLGHQKGVNISQDQFFHRGLQILAEETCQDAELQEAIEQRANAEEEGREYSRDITLLEGKLK